MTARLILAVGSRAGLEAPLHTGYYMIGRHKECQIRPKSRSVSRRHCLLHHDEQGLKVLDLESSAGTYVDNVRLEPKRWYPLKDGGELRCGKVLFRAGVGGSSEAIVPSKDLVPAGAASIVSGEAWHDVDVAGFLDAEDSVDRERRYADIRSAHDSEEIEEDVGFTVTDEMDEFEDAFSEDSFHSYSASQEQSPVSVTNQSNTETQNADTSLEGSNGAAAPETQSKTDQPKTTQAKSVASSGATARPATKTKPQRLPKAKRRKLERGPRSLSLSFGGGEQWKLVGAVVLTVAMLGFFGFKAYQLYKGPEVRVLQGID